MTDLIVGNVYEIDPIFKFSYLGRTSGDRFFARLIGFSSDDQPVFENNGKFIEVSMNSASIKELK